MMTGIIGTGSPVQASASDAQSEKEPGPEPGRAVRDLTEALPIAA
jgi:hypothetical protein